MNCRSVPAELFTLYADNGDPLLLYGKDADGFLMLWPTPFIERHRIAFGRWCRQNIERYRGCRVTICHPLSWKTERWAAWLGVHIENGQITV